VYYVAAGFELVRDLTPARRRSRYGDIDFDFEHGVDTTWANIGLRTRLREWISGGQYQPSEPELFHRIISDLPVKPDGLTFIDLGSGKGRTLLMASEYPFRNWMQLLTRISSSTKARTRDASLSNRVWEMRVSLTSLLSQSSCICSILFRNACFGAFWQICTSRYEWNLEM